MTDVMSWLQRARFRAVGLSCGVLALAMAAPAAQASEQRTRLFVNLTSELGGYVPHQNSGEELYGFFRHVYDPLVNANLTEYTPGLACSWERPDPTTWRFHLCPQATFANGTPVTAADVLFSFDLLANDSTSLQIGSVRAITEVIAVDEHTVDFKTDEPDSMFLGAIGDRSIQSQAHYAELGPEAATRTPMGSGPYRITEIRPGERYVLERRDDYWATDVLPDMHPTLASGTAPDQLIYRFIREPEAQVTALLNGELDVITDVPAQFLPRLQQAGAHVGSNKNGQHIFFVMNPITEAMGDRRVRQAIVHAIDVGALIAGPLRGAAYQLTGPVDEDMSTYSSETPQQEFDPERARELLAEAGYSGGLTINMKCPTGQWLAEQEVCQATQAMLADVGITANLRFVEWTTYSAQYRNAADPGLEYEFFLTGARSPGGDAGFYDNWLECSGRTAYCNEAIAGGFATARATLDDEERVGIYHQVWADIMEDAPAVFLWLYRVNYATAPHVTGDPLEYGRQLATVLSVQN